MLAELIQLNERFVYDLRITPTGKLGVCVQSSDGGHGALYQQLSGY